MNMIEIMNSVFSLFSNDKAIYDGYYINDETGLDKDWIKYSKLIQSDVHNFHPFYIAKVENKGIDYFILYDQSNHEELDYGEIYTEIDMNAGIFCLLLHSFKESIKPNISQNEVEEYIFYLPAKDQHYKGHNYQQLEKYFSKMHIFESKTEIDIYKFIIDLCINNQYLSPNISESYTFTLFEELSDINNQIPLNNISKAVMHYKAEQVFMELYKLVERLYPIPYISDLRDAIGGQKINFWILFDNINNLLKWNYKETNAIEKLFDIVDEQQMSKIVSDLEKTLNKNDLNVAKTIYDIRCRIVHESLNHNHISFNNQEWEIIFQSLLIIIKNLYKKYNVILKDAI